ncbi:MAG: acyltransferase family protein [Oscillospiraceae bacterium]|nr:acyltransferase family protein [Oscillospiraceae bacterium]
MAEIRQRYSWIDIARGAAIALIAVGHYIPKQVLGAAFFRLILYTLYAFHVPMFFILSGYTADFQASPADFVKRRLKSLIAPWFLFTLVGAALRLLWGGLTAAHLPHYFLYGNLANPSAWFLPILFISQCLWFFIVRLCSRAKVQKKLFFYLSFAVCLYVSGYFTYRAQPFLPFGLQRAVYGAFFVAVGSIAAFLFPAEASLRTLSLGRVKLLLSGALLLAAVTLIASAYDSYFDLAQMHFPNYWLFALTGTLGSVGVALISMGIGQCRLLESYGQNSLFICLTHEYLIGLFNNSGPLYRHLFPSSDVSYFFLIAAGGLWFIAFMLFYYPLCKWKNTLLKKIGWQGR